jgi:hypothetical protein
MAAWYTSLTKWFSRNNVAVTTPGATGRQRGGTWAGGPENGGLEFDAYSYVTEQLQIDRTRREVYADYDQMDWDAPEAHRALNVFADTALQGVGAEDGDVILIDARAPGVKNVIEGIERNVKLFQRAWGVVRSTAKYGDLFQELVFDNNGVLRRLKTLPARSIRRKVDQYGTPDEYPWRQHGGYGEGPEVARFREWQIVHYGNVPEGELYGYSQSLLAAARKPWRAVEMAQAAVLAERILRSGARMVFPVDVTGLSTDEAIEYIRNVKREYNRTQNHNAATGRRTGRFSPPSAVSDIWVPWTKDGPQKPVDVLQMSVQMGEIGDIKFHHSRFLSALETPSYLLGFDEDLRSRSATGYIDVGYLRTVIRGQKAYLRGVTEVVNRALWSAGFDAALDGDYKELWSASFPRLQLIDEKIKWEIEEIKANVARVYGLDLGSVNDEFILRTFLGLSDEEIADALPDEPKVKPGEPPAKTADGVKAAEALLRRLPTGSALRRLSAVLSPTEANRVRMEIRQLIKIAGKPVSTDDLETGSN